MGARTSFRIAAAPALLLTLAAPAAAQRAAPTGVTTLSFGYDRLLSGDLQGTMQGFHVTVDRPLWRHLTIAWGGSLAIGGRLSVFDPSISDPYTALRNFIAGTPVRRSYFGTGPGMRLPLGESRRTHVFAHVLLGHLHQRVDIGGPEPHDPWWWDWWVPEEGRISRFSARYGAGIDFPLGSLRLRAGVDYDGETHILGGAVLVF